MTGTSINSLLLLGELIQCGMVCGKQFCCNTSLFFLEFSFWRLSEAICFCLPLLAKYHK